MPDRRERKSERPQAEVEEIPAEQVTIGRMVFFPNSRKAQEVKTVFAHQQQGTITLSTEDAEWTMALADVVRAVKEDESDG